jgi:hypothetical protein
MEHLTLLQKLRSIAVLAGCLFSLAMLVIAPIELYAVHRVRSWQPVNATVVSAEISQHRWRGLTESGHYTFTDTETGQVVSTADIRPGDLPFHLSLGNSKTWSTHRKDISSYTADAEVTVYRSPNGKDYFLEQGSYRPMTLLLLGALLWWGVIIVIARRGKSRA